MGFLHESSGRITIEARSETFVVHPSYGFEGHSLSDEVVVGGERVERRGFCRTWRQYHPEFLYDDLDDLIAALEALRGGLREAG